MVRRLSLEGLVLAAGTTELVHGIDLAVERGRVAALVGNSGGGKSLSVLAWLGLLPPGVRRRAGTVRRDGEALEAAQQAELRGRCVGLVPQSPTSCLNPLVTIGRHFRETLACAGLGARAARTEAAARLAEVGFDPPARLLGLYPCQLSGGMLQRVVIALALCRDPDFLFADEATTDLDLESQAQVLGLLERLRDRRGIGLLLVTHDLAVVARLADEAAVLQHGRIVERRSVAELFAAPRAPATRALLAAHRALYRGGCAA